MGTLRIIVRNDALSFIEKTTEWYSHEMGTKAAKHYSFLSHPKYRIIYRFTKTNLYIVAIRATMMKRN